MSRLAISRFQLVAAALLFSTGGAAIKFCSLNAWQVASIRSGIAALAVLVFVPSTRRGWSVRTLAVAIAYAATMVLFVLSTKWTTSANAIFLQSTAPLYIVLASPWLLGERIRKRDWAVLAAIAAGLVLFFTGAEQVSATAPQPIRGNLAALASGFTWALTVMGLRWLSAKHSTGDTDSSGDDAAGGAAATVALGNLLAFLICLPLALPGLLATAQPRDWLTIVYLGVFQIGLAYVLLTRGLRHIPALDASLLLLVEPVLNPLWAWLVQGERPSTWAVAGGCVILGATAAKAWLDNRAGDATSRP